MIRSTMTREVITSRQNHWYKRFRAALERHDDEIVVEGRKFVDDCLAAGLEPIALAVDASIDYPTRRRPLFFETNVFRQLSGTETSQGVIAMFRRPRASLGDLPSAGELCVLDGVQDPGNVGAIIRLAVAFDCAGVVLLENCADPYSPKVIRASVGAIFATAIVRAKRRELLEYAEAEGRPLYVLDAQAKKRFDSIPERSAIVFGSEGGGVSEVIASRASAVSIPMTDRVESLNVATAAAIVLQRLFERR